MRKHSKLIKELCKWYIDERGKDKPDRLDKFLWKYLAPLLLVLGLVGLYVF